MTDYSKVEYWDDRYDANPDPFDWYQVYSILKEKLGILAQPEDRILVVGAGNSTLSECLYEEGFKYITNMDFSRWVVKIMNERYISLGYDIKYLEMNALDMNHFHNEQFNVIFDKGTLDSVLCGENAIPLVDKMMKEIYRVLAINGVFFCISYGDEDHRKTYLTTQDWEITTDIIPKLSKDISANVDSGNKDSKNYHYIYKMIKKGK